MEQKKIIQVTERQTYLDVQHPGETLRFIAPSFGYNTYANVGNEIINAKLSQPTMAQNASLVRAAWENSTEKYSAEIISKMRSNWLWSFNGILYVPNEGAYIQDRPEIAGNSIVMNRDDLVNKLQSGDKSVRYISFDKIQSGEQSSYSALAKNNFVIALAGEEGAEKLAEVASKHRNKPYVWALTETNSEQKRVACLSSSWGGDYGLYVLGYGRFGSGDVVGFAFGVSDPDASEAGSRKK